MVRVILSLPIALLVWASPISAFIESTTAAGLLSARRRTSIGIRNVGPKQHQQQEHQQQSQVAPVSRIYSSGGNGEIGENDDMNLEEERRRLESLLGMSSSSADGTTPDATRSAVDEHAQPDLTSLPLSEWKRDIRNAPLLTSIARERLEAEIAFLESLADSDDAIPQLWNLWYNARGPVASRDLMATERLVAQAEPDAWKEAETRLRELIAREGIHWVEPVNRLATLLFLQSRFEESLELCLIVLQLKPWHFGALSGIVLVYKGLQDDEGMMEYSQRLMPKLPKSTDEAIKMEERALKDGVDTRQTWVYRMVDLAKASLLKSEMILDESFQDLDENNHGEENLPNNDEWQ